MIGSRTKMPMSKAQSDSEIILCLFLQVPKYSVRFEEGYLASDGEVLQEAERFRHAICLLKLAEAKGLEGLGVGVLHPLPGLDRPTGLQELLDEAVADAGRDLAHVQGCLFGRHDRWQRIPVS